MAEPENAVGTEQEGAEQTGEGASIGKPDGEPEHEQGRTSESGGGEGGDGSHEAVSPAGEPLGEVHGQGESPHARAGHDPDRAERTDPNVPRTGSRTKPVKEKGFTTP